MWKLRLSVDLKCPVHPRYNPTRSGREGVKAGCRICEAMAIANEKLVEGHGVRDWIAAAQEMIEEKTNHVRTR
jgi:hypothetical protein